MMFLCSCGKPSEQREIDHAPERIISLAPNITETLYDLGLNNRIVGISRFSAADETSGLPIVGDFMNVNYEKIVTLQPDLVILEKSSDDQKARLESLNIPYLETGSLSVVEVLESIQRIGKACGAEERAAGLIEHLQEQMHAASNDPPHRTRTLIAFSDFSNRDKVEQIYAFGPDCIHSELLVMAGGENVVTDRRPSVTLSLEAVIRMNPELIIELSAGGPTNQWSNLASVDAVRNHRIHVLDGTYTTIPSPRSLMRTLEDFSRILQQYD